MPKRIIKEKEKFFDEEEYNDNIENSFFIDDDILCEVNKKDRKVTQYEKALFNKYQKLKKDYDNIHRNLIMYIEDPINLIIGDKND